MNISLQNMSNYYDLSEPASSIRAGSTPGYTWLIISKLLGPWTTIIETENRIPWFLIFFFSICCHYFLTVTSIWASCLFNDTKVARSYTCLLSFNFLNIYFDQIKSVTNQSINIVESTINQSIDTYLYIYLCSLH